MLKCGFIRIIVKSIHLPLRSKSKMDMDFLKTKYYLYKLKNRSGKHTGITRINSYWVLENQSLK